MIVNLVFLFGILIDASDKCYDPEVNEDYLECKERILQDMFLLFNFKILIRIKAHFNQA